MKKILKKLIETRYNIILKLKINIEQFTKREIIIKEFDQVNLNSNNKKQIKKTHVILNKCEDKLVSISKNPQFYYLKFYTTS